MSRPSTISKDEPIIGCAHGAGKSEPAAFIWLGTTYEFVDEEKNIFRSQWAVLCVPCFEMYREDSGDTLTSYIRNVFKFDHDVKMDQGAVS